MNLEHATYYALKHLGVTANLRGYKYLHEAIMYLAKEPDALHSMTKVMYPHIAKQFNTTPSRVERSMRYAIDYVFSNTDPSVLYDFFGNTNSIETGKITNSQFIAGMCEYIRMEVQYDEH